MKSAVFAERLDIYTFTIMSQNRKVEFTFSAKNHVQYLDLKTTIDTQIAEAMIKKKKWIKQENNYVTINYLITKFIHESIKLKKNI